MRRALGIAALGVECLVLLLVLHDPVAAAQLTLTWADAVGSTQYLVERENISLGLFAELASARMPPAMWTRPSSPA